MPEADREATIRDRLGIPPHAERVLVFCESSHWDTNWLRTSEGYFTHRLEPIFARILAALEADARRIYCIESVFFLKLFWERHPEAQPRLRSLIDGRQLRLSASSFTTPDTLLPHPEAILRDFHLGQEWLRANGLSAAPHTAYFPDNFGHSPHLPSLMRAVGVDAVAVTRVDGMYFVAADYRRKSAFPRQGSTAELLQRELRTLDFVWRDDDGAEVLCHWNAFTYFQGDMLAHVGIVRWSGHVAAIPWRTRRHIAGRIDAFVRQLAPLARTPYLLCPIGMDFNDPIADLRGLLDRYNRERAPRTGTWTVLAGFDDYLELLGCRREALPVLELDPNPYWMGFYASRPELKQRPTRIARTLVLAENLSAAEPPVAAVEASLRQAWSRLVLINHHDAITGTSPDRVSETEQRAWLDEAETGANVALSLAASRLGGSPAVPATPAAPPRWSRADGVVHVETSHYRLAFSEARGGCLISLVVDGAEQLAGLGLDLVAFADEGGLWRLGHEYLGGRFHEVDRLSRRPAAVEVVELDGCLEVRIAGRLRGQPFRRVVTCHPDFLEILVAGTAGRRCTVTCRCDVTPVPSLVSLRGGPCTVHLGFEAPTAVSFGPPQALEWIVSRNAPKERAFRFLPVLAHPVGGGVGAAHSHRAALLITRGPSLPDEARRRIHLAWYPPEQRQLRQFADALVSCDDPAVSIAASKRADVGRGVIVRLAGPPRSPRTVRLGLPSREVQAAFLCNAREQDLRRLEVQDGRALVPVASRLTSVRLVLGETDRVEPAA